MCCYIRGFLLYKTNNDVMLHIREIVQDNSRWTVDQGPIFPLDLDIIGPRSIPR